MITVVKSSSTMCKRSNGAVLVGGTSLFLSRSPFISSSKDAIYVFKQKWDAIYRVPTNLAMYAIAAHYSQHLHSCVPAIARRRWRDGEREWPRPARGAWRRR